MLAYAKPLLTSSAAARQVLVAFAAKQEVLTLFYQTTSRKHSNAGKSLEDISPPYLLNQLKYSSDSYLQRDFHDDDSYERYSQMIPRNITKDAASISNNQDDITYDEDYDQFYSHMTPSSMTSQDHEHLDSLEMIQHDDVEPTVGLRINNPVTDIEYNEAMAEGDPPCYDAKAADYVRLEDREYVELEEDWEIMHQCHRQGKTSQYEVCDNIDDE
ncbi:hypothetical protein ACHAWO_005615 [Cyclotella atomus]|uniref:Uncharacterized protein n=1 Tax=Cyclotella atomus TaxID=382360 RepID=A0ABD3QSG5_9STRA